MVAEDLTPVRLVMEADHNVPHFHQAMGDSLVLPYLIRLVVMWAINIDRGVVLAVIEIRASRAGLDKVLSLTWRAQQQRIHKVEPSPFELTVTLFSKRDHAFLARACAT